MPAEETAPGQKPNGQERAGEQSPFMNVLLPVLTVVGTGIGAIGFVIFFGGFVVWSRFEAAGLPANEAVAQVPRNDLVVTGASFLVPALLGALLASVVAVAAWDAAIGSRRRGREAAARANVIRADSALSKLQAEHQRVEGKIAALESRMKEHKEASAAADPGSEARADAREAHDEAEREALDLKERLAELDERQIPDAEALRAKVTEAEPKAKKSDRRERLLQIAIGGIPMLVAEILVVSFGWDGLSCGYQALLVVVMITTIGVAIVVISMTDHFAWFTLCVFLGVGITIAASTYARTQSRVKVSPVAAMSGTDPVAGFFVAETGDAVYLGVPDGSPQWEGPDELEFDHDVATLVRIPKASVSGLTVGPIMEEDDAYRRSIVLALALCRHARQNTVVTERTRTAKGTRAKRSSKTRLGCTPNRVLQLKRQLAAATPGS